MKHLALFNGIGGFQLAANWVGWDNVASVEINEFANRITKFHFPNCQQFTDIKSFDGTIYKGAIEVITGGFPCQPFSHAGKREGTDDNRYLWPEMLRVIREVAPSYVVAENVSGILTIENGMVFEQVCLDLENEGYEVQTFIIPACAIDAPHRRDRVWFVATNANRNGRNQCDSQNEVNTGKGRVNALRNISTGGEHGLLPTVQTQGLKVSDKNGKTQFMDLRLLPTPTASETIQPIQPREVFGNNRVKSNSGTEGQCKLTDLAMNNMLPTPQSRDWKGQQGRADKDGVMDLPAVVNAQAGITSQLNPQFVGEMMGFPENWTLLPFLNGETKA